MKAAPFYPYEGPEHLREPIGLALARVVDPEVAMNVLDVGLVYGVAATEVGVTVTMTMTSAACPVIDVILEDVQDELESALPETLGVDVRLVWDPPWSTDRMSARAKAFMGW